MRFAVCLLLAALIAAPGLGCGESNPPAKTRRYSFRAIGGASMGAITAGQMGLRHHELFDILGPSGGGLDLTSLIRYFHEGMLGGFCIPPEAGQLCRSADQTQDYEHMDCGGPNAGGFDRKSMIEAFKDMFIAYGNLALFNPEVPYLPPGIDREWVSLSNEEKCGQPVRLPAYFDRDFNPEGTYPAITYCEANSETQGLFDPAVEPWYPVEILLALDLNDNGKRDSGEPVLFRQYEPYQDVGEDGVASAGEPGYDAVANPDPAGDDYAPWTNPLGTEGNYAFDDGEPFEDTGLDGVPGTAASPYDWGEGNGRMDYNPHVLSTAVGYDASRLVRSLPRQALDRLDFYIDVGIRDHLGFRPSSEAFVGLLNALGRSFDVRDSYESLLRADYTGAYDIHQIDWANVGRDVFLRFGNPDATEGEIAAGDGGHVGTAAQLVYRAITLMAFISARWPEGDFSRVTGSGRMVDVTLPSEILDEDRQFFVYLPPGYDDNPDLRYPVAYLIHGIGMSVDTLTAMVLLAEPWMAEGTLQKYIIVFPDGECREDCFDGTFFVNQQGRDQPPNRYEDYLFQELIPFVDRTYRTKAPKDIPL